MLSFWHCFLMLPPWICISQLSSGYFLFVIFFEESCLCFALLYKCAWDFRNFKIPIIPLSLLSNWVLECLLAFLLVIQFWQRACFWFQTGISGLRRSSVVYRRIDALEKICIDFAKHDKQVVVDNWLQDVEFGSNLYVPVAKWLFDNFALNCNG